MSDGEATLANSEWRSLATVTIIVRNYDDAIEWYRDKLGCLLIQDTNLGNGKRWVVVAPSISDGARLLLAQPANQRQSARIGDQTGGRVGFFIQTDDIERDFARMSGRGVSFQEPPREEAYGRVAVFSDLYGNLFDLIEPARR